MAGAQHSLLIGANSSIAQALTQQLLARSSDSLIYAVSRDTSGLQQHNNVIPINCNYSSKDSETEIADTIAELARQQVKPVRVVICNGVLHSADWMPEKRLEDISSEQFLASMYSNTLVPLLWLKHLLPLLNHGQECVIILFGARVGSIGDNRLGGWYSYRASKAALTMAAKTAAVEYARRAKQVKLAVFHPGTTDTPLSKPFQGNVPEGKLFTAEFVARQLLSISDDLEPDGQLSYLDWQGKTIPW